MRREERDSCLCALPNLVDGSEGPGRKTNVLCDGYIFPSPRPDSRSHTRSTTSSFSMRLNTAVGNRLALNGLGTHSCSISNGFH